LIWKGRECEGGDCRKRMFGERGKEKKGLEVGEDWRSRRGVHAVFRLLIVRKFQESMREGIFDGRVFSRQCLKKSTGKLNQWGLSATAVSSLVGAQVPTRGSMW